MKCKKCNGETRVIYSFKTDDEVLRRRECKECSDIFYTKEIIAPEIQDNYWVKREERYRQNLLDFIKKNN